MPQPNSPSYRSSRRNRSRSPDSDRNRRQSYREKSRSRSRGSDNYNSSNNNNYSRSYRRDNEYDSNRYDRYDRYDNNNNNNDHDKYDKYNNKYNDKYNDKYDRYDKYNKYDKYEKYNKYDQDRTRDKYDRNRDRDRDRDSIRSIRPTEDEIKRRKSRFSSYSNRPRSEFKHPTNIAIMKGAIPSSYTAINILSSIGRYKPFSISIIREGNTLLSEIKYILIVFENISSTISFVEENKYSPGQFMVDSIELKLNYFKINGVTENENDINTINALQSDWLCSKCYYYNKYDKESIMHKCKRSDCKSLMTTDSIRVDKITGSPYIFGEIITDKVKGNKINLKSSSVLVIEGIDISTTEDIIKYSFASITNEIEYVYIVNKNNTEYNRLCIAFLQFKTPNIAKSVLKQALLNNITISSLPINLAFVQYNGVNNTTEIVQQQAQQQQQLLAESIALSTTNSVNPFNLLIPKASDFGIADTFQWDATANCFYDTQSGYYYDIHRNLYYFNGNWYNWDPNIVQYVQVKDPHAVDENDEKDEKVNKDIDGDVNMKPKDNNESKVEEQQQSGPIKFGFKSQNNGKMDDKNDENIGGNNENKKMDLDKNISLEITKQQKDMMNDLPISYQEKVEKFCNKEKLCCYLCRRKFKNICGLSEHVKLSEFHLFNLLKWISNKRIEINNVAAKFYSTIKGNSDVNIEKKGNIEGKDKKIMNKNKGKGSDNSTSLQDKFLSMMNAYDNSRCDKSSDGGIRALMK